jgi:hypothetical protein
VANLAYIRRPTDLIQLLVLADSAALTGLTFDSHRSDRSEQRAQMPIGLHHCVDLVETIEMHMWNVQFGVRMRELWSWQESALCLTGLTSGTRRSDRCSQPNPS